MEEFIDEGFREAPVASGAGAAEFSFPEPAVVGGVRDAEGFAEFSAGEEIGVVFYVSYTIKYYRQCHMISQWDAPPSRPRSPPGVSAKPTASSSTSTAPSCPPARTSIPSTAASRRRRQPRENRPGPAPDAPRGGSGQAGGAGASRTLHRRRRPGSLMPLRRTDRCFVLSRDARRHPLRPSRAIIGLTPEHRHAAR